MVSGALIAAVRGSDNTHASARFRPRAWWARAREVARGLARSATSNRATGVGSGPTDSHDDVKSFDVTDIPEGSCFPRRFGLEF